jgi:hypothetical protein
MVNVQRWEKSGLKEGTAYRFRMYSQDDELLHEVITDNPSTKDCQKLIEANVVSRGRIDIAKIYVETINYPVRLGYDA